MAWAIFTRNPLGAIFTLRCTAILRRTSSAFPRYVSFHGVDQSWTEFWQTWAFPSLPLGPIAKIAQPEKWKNSLGNFYTNLKKTKF